MSIVEPELQDYLLNFQHNNEFSDKVDSSVTNCSCTSSTYDSSSSCDVENRKKDEKLRKQPKDTLRDSNTERTSELTNSSKQRSSANSVKSSNKKRKNSKIKSEGKRQKINESRHYPSNELFSNESIMRLLQFGDSLHQYSSYSPGKSSKCTNTRSADSGIDLHHHGNQFQDGGNLRNNDIDSDEESFTEDQLTLIESVLSLDGPDNNTYMLSNNGSLATNGDMFHCNGINQSCDTRQTNVDDEVKCGTSSYSPEGEHLATIDHNICNSSISVTKQNYDTLTCVQGSNNLLSSDLGTLDDNDILLTNQNEVDNELSSQSHSKDNDVLIVSPSKTCSQTCDNDLHQLKVEPREEESSSFPSHLTECFNESSEIVDISSASTETYLLSQPTSIEFMDIDIQQEVEIMQPIGDGNSGSTTDEIILENDMKLVRKSRSRRRTNSTRTAKSSTRKSTQAKKKASVSENHNADTKMSSTKSTPDNKLVSVSDTSNTNSSKKANTSTSLANKNQGAVSVDGSLSTSEKSTLIEQDVTLEDSTSLEVDGCSESHFLNSLKDGTDALSSKLFTDNKAHITAAISLQENTLLRTEDCLSSQLTSNACIVDNNNRNHSSFKAKQLINNTYDNGTLSNTELSITNKLTPKTFKVTTKHSSSSKTPVTRQTTTTVTSDKGKMRCSPGELELPDDLNISSFQDKETSFSAIDFLMQIDEDDVDAAIDSMLSNQCKSFNAFSNIILPQVTDTPLSNGRRGSSCSSITLSSVSTELHGTECYSNDDINTDKNDNDDNVVSDSLSEDNVINKNRNGNSITLLSVSTELHSKKSNNISSDKNDDDELTTDSITNDTSVADNNHKKESDSILNSDSSVIRNGHDDIKSTIVDDNTKTPVNPDDKNQSKDSISVDDDCDNLCASVINEDKNTSNNGGYTNDYDDDIDINMVDDDNTMVIINPTNKNQSEELNACVDNNHDKPCDVSINEDKKDVIDNVPSGNITAHDSSLNLNMTYTSDDSDKDVDIKTDLVDGDSSVTNDSVLADNVSDNNQMCVTENEGPSHNDDIDRSNIVTGIVDPSKPNSTNKNQSTNTNYKYNHDESSNDDYNNKDVVDCESIAEAVNYYPSKPNSTNQNQITNTKCDDDDDDESSTDDDINMDTTDRHVAVYNNSTEDSAINIDNSSSSSCEGTTKTGGDKNSNISLFDYSDNNTQLINSQTDDSVSDSNEYDDDDIDSNDTDDNFPNNSQDLVDLSDVPSLPEVEFCEITINNEISEPVDRDCPFLPPERTPDGLTKLMTKDTEFYPLKSKEKVVTSKKHEILPIKTKEKVMTFFTSTPKLPVKKTVKKAEKVTDVATNESTKEIAVVMTEERKKYFLDKFVNNGKKMNLEIRFLPIKSKKKTKFKVLPRNPTLTNQIGQTESNTSLASNSPKKASNCVPTNVPNTSASTGDCLTRKYNDQFERAIHKELNLSTNSCSEEKSIVKPSQGKDLRTEINAEENETDISTSEKESSDDNCRSIMFKDNYKHQSTRMELQCTSKLLHSKQQDNVQPKDLEVVLKSDVESQIEKDCLISENVSSESEQHSDITQNHKVTPTESSLFLKANIDFREQDAKQMENTVTPQQARKEYVKDHDHTVEVSEERPDNNGVEMGQILIHTKESNEGSVEVSAGIVKVNEEGEERKLSSPVEVESRSFHVEVIHSQKEHNDNDVQVITDTTKVDEQVNNNIADGCAIENEAISCCADKETSEGNVEVVMDTTENKPNSVFETDLRTIYSKHVCNNVIESIPHDIEMETSKHEECRQVEEMMNGSPKQPESNDNDETSSVDKNKGNKNLPEEVALIPMEQDDSHLNKEHSDTNYCTNLLKDDGNTKNCDEDHTINSSNKSIVAIEWRCDPTTDHGISCHDKHSSEDVASDQNNLTEQCLIDPSKSISTLDYNQAEDPLHNINDSKNMYDSTTSKQVNIQDFINQASSASYSSTQKTSEVQDLVCNKSETSTSTIVKNTLSCCSTKDENQRSELCTTMMNSSKFSVDDSNNGVPLVQYEMHSFTEDVPSGSSITAGQEDPKQHAITINFDNNISSNTSGQEDPKQHAITINFDNNISSNTSAASSSKKFKSTNRKRKYFEPYKETASLMSKKGKFEAGKVPREMSFASQGDECNTSNCNEISPSKPQRNNEQKLLLKYYKEKMKSLKKENENLKNKTMMFDWISDLKDEIRHLKRSVEMLQRRSDEQQSVIFSQELTIHRLEQSLISNQGVYPNSSASLQVIDERQDATITSSDTDMR